DRISEEPEPQKEAGAIRAPAFDGVERIRLEYLEPRQDARIYGPRRPVELHGEGNRCALGDSLLQSASDAGIVGTEQLDLLTALLVALVSSRSGVTRVQYLDHLRVGQRCIIDRREMLVVGRLPEPPRRVGCNRIGVFAAHSSRPSFGIGERLEEPHVQVELFAAILLARAAGEECEWLEVWCLGRPDRDRLHQAAQREHVWAGAALAAMHDVGARRASR